MGAYKALALQAMRRGSGFVSDQQKMNAMPNKMSWWEKAKVGALGWVDPSLSANYLDTKMERQTAGIARENIRGVQGELMDLAGNQTEAQRQLINRQLKESIKTMNQQRATSGSLRTGATIKDTRDMTRQASEATASVSAQNALQAKLAGLGYEGDVKNFDLKLSQLEAAKQAGDAESMGLISEAIGSSGFLDKLLGLSPEAAPEAGISANPEEMAGGIPSMDFPFNSEAMQSASNYNQASKGGFTLSSLFGGAEQEAPAQASWYNTNTVDSSVYGSQFVKDPYTGQDIDLSKILAEVFGGE